jgi:hypothetical protein
MTKTEPTPPDIRLWYHMREAERKIRAATTSDMGVTSKSHSQVLHAIFSSDDAIKTAMGEALKAPLTGQRPR